jgi:hypothetical protein
MSEIYGVDAVASRGRRDFWAFVARGRGAGYVSWCAGPRAVLPGRGSHRSLDAIEAQHRAMSGHGHASSALAGDADGVAPGIQTG